MTSTAYVKSLIDLVTANDGALVKTKENNLLNASYAHSKKFYYDEKIPAPGIAYTILVDANDLKNKKVTTEVVPGHFDRTAVGDEKWQNQSEKVFKKVTEQKTPSNGKMIHPVKVSMKPEKVKVSGFNVDDEGIHFQVQQCGYFDQVATHLGIDYKENTDDESLREMIAKANPGKLPPLGLMSNSFGVSLVLFYKDGDQYVPALYKRNKNVAVFSETLNSTSSGAVSWPEQDENVEILDVLVNHQFTELLEETGLEEDQVKDLQCVGIAREHSRGGKFQAFYAARTDLTREQLIEIFKKNSRAIKNPKDVEYAEQILEGRIDALATPEEMYNYIKEFGWGPEGVANVYLAQPYLENLVVA